MEKNFVIQNFKVLKIPEFKLQFCLLAIYASVSWTVVKRYYYLFQCGCIKLMCEKCTESVHSLSCY
jgi:hypothetical protein